MFASDDVVTLDHCWSFLNGKPPGGNNPAGDGNGFKLGGAPTSPGEGGAVHVVTNCASFENLTCGFVRNNNPDVPALSDCSARANPSGNYCQLTCDPTHSMTMTGDQAKAVQRNADGSLPAIQ